MANIVVIQGHPDKNGARFCRALALAYIQGARTAGHIIREVDVANLDFPLIKSEADFVSDAVPPDIASAQEAIAWANHLVIIYPLWLGTMPALLKAAFEQIFRYGFGMAKPDEGRGRLLKGRSARIIITMGMPAFVFRWFFRAHSLKSLERNILWLCGIGPIRETLIGGSGLTVAKNREAWLEKIRKLGALAK